jgi:hypothetical protein
MRYRLRTLLIVLALGPPLIAMIWRSFTDAALIFLTALMAVAIATVIEKFERAS